MKVSDLGLDERIVSTLSRQGIEELYPPQAESIEAALAGRSIVLAIPTAAGKSLIAYLAAVKSVMAGGKALYIVPLRALASEKYDDLKEFESLGIKVGISVGDYDTPDPTLEKYDIIIATSEKADSLLRHKTNWLKRLTTVVADEVHLINDGDRGPTLEVTLAKLKQVNPSAQIVALSATIKNSAVLAEWLKAEHFRSEWRPVPLKQGVCWGGSIHFTDGSVRIVPSDGEEMLSLVTDTVKEGGQTLIFVNTRRSTEALATSLASQLKKQLDPQLREKMKEMAEDLSKRQDEPTSMIARLAKCIEGGVAFHNAGLTNDQRRLVEQNFKKGRIKCIVATPTLCMHPDTLITTERGPVKISEIRKGDRVLTAMGRFQTVLGISRRPFEGELLEIKADGMLPIRMTGEHRVLRNIRYRFGHHGKDGVWHKIIRSEPAWVTAKELAIDNEVLSPVEVPERLPDGGGLVIPLHNKTFVGRNQFGAVFPHPIAKRVPELMEVDEDLARFFGLYAAEGFTGRNGVVGFAIATYEDELSDFIYRMMANTFRLSPKIRDAERHRRVVSCCSRVLAEFMTKSFGRGATRKHFPEYFAGGPQEIIRGLVRGAWEGDGTIDPGGFSRARFATVSPRLAEQMLRMLKRLGYMPSVRVAPPRGMGRHQMYTLALSGTQGDRFLIEVMGVESRLLRKGNRSYNTKNLVGSSFRSPVRKLKRIPYSGEVCNLHVEDDESYVCAFGFAVHNSAGINLPARRVVVRDLSRFDVTYGNASIPVLEIKQMCGRAGRPRFDSFGEAVLIAKRQDDIEELSNAYFLSEPEAIVSKLGAEPALRVHILASIATEHTRTEKEIFDFIGSTFFAHCEDVENIRDKVEEVLAFLQREEFVKAGDGLRATQFGKRTSDLYIDPLSAVKMRDHLKGNLESDFAHLWAVSSTPDMPKLYLRRGDYQWVDEKIVFEGLTFPVEDYDFMMAEVKTAALLEDWMEERYENDITKRFGIGPGDIRRLTDNAKWLMYSMQELARLFNKARVRQLSRLVLRQTYGVKEELLELVELRGVGRVRGRALFSRGFKTLRDLQKADIGDIARIASIGPAVATKIKEQVGAGEEELKGPFTGQSGIGEFE